MFKMLDINAPAAEYLVQPTNGIDIDAGALYDRVNADLESVQDFFYEKAIERNRNFDFYANRQWTEKELYDHERQHRHPYQFNEIQSKIDHLMGMQVQTRMDTKCIAREKGDEAIAAALSHLVKWVEQVNDFESTTTDVFMDGIVGKAGWALVRWEIEDISHGYPVIERVPSSEMFFDLCSKRSDKRDARWMARVLYKDRMEVIEMFPDKKEEIAGLTNAWTSGSSGHGRFKLFSSFERRYMNRTSNNFAGRDLIEIIEHYERIKVCEYIVEDEIRGATMRFDDEIDATSYYQGLIDVYTENGENLINPDASPRVAYFENPKESFIQTIVVGEKTFVHDVISTPFFPYVPFFAYHWDGDIWATADSLISPQILVNRFFSQWDYQVGASTKNLMTVMSSMMPKDFPVERLREELSKPMSVIPVLRHDAIDFKQNTPVNPELFQGIGWGVQRMNDYAGGRNVLGLQENAAESGKAVQARAEQGGLGRLPLFDKLRKFKIGVIERVVWYLKNCMPSSQIIRVLGSDPDTKYTPLEDSVLNTLSEIKIDITVDETIKSDSMKERYLQYFRDFIMAVPEIPVEFKIKLFLEYSPLPEGKKDELLNLLPFWQQFQQQNNKVQKEQKLQGEVQDSLYKKMIKEQQLRAEEAKEAESQTMKQERGLETELKKLEQLKQEAGGAPVNV